MYTKLACAKSQFCEETKFMVYILKIFKKLKKGFQLTLWVHFAKTDVN